MSISTRKIFSVKNEDGVSFQEEKLWYLGLR